MFFLETVCDYELAVAGWCPPLEIPDTGSTCACYIFIHAYSIYLHTYTIYIYIYMHVN